MKNDLILKALKGEEVPRPPVWMMRQAGRYLPEYRVLRKKYSFFERCMNPELACEITLQPVDIIGVDAAIIFSDILVIPQAMGMDVQMVPGKGPLLPNPITSNQDIDNLVTEDVQQKLDYVYQALKTTKSALAGRVPLIGFGGSPWTLLCYMVEGEGSKTFSKAKSFCYKNPAEADRLLQKITDASIQYLKGKVEAGADVIQIFDSWGGILSPLDYNKFSLPYIQQIVGSLKEIVPTIIYSKGAWFAMEDLARTGASGISIDWTVTPDQARKWVGPQITLQGNLDPSFLKAPRSEIVERTKKMIQSFGDHRYIANLGHGILPDIPVDHARAFVETVKAYSS